MGLLADDDRRQCLAALELGATTQDAIVAATGLTVPRVAKALGRLISGGLVVAGSDGGIYVLSSAFRVAARQALSRPPSAEHDDAPADTLRVMRTFVADGRITQIPTSLAKRRVLLDWLGHDFEPGRRYSEKMVNLILGKRHPDTAAWRRYLVDDRILGRDGGEYWRCGGTHLP